VLDDFRHDGVAGSGECPDQAALSAPRAQIAVRLIREFAGTSIRIVPAFSKFRAPPRSRENKQEPRFARAQVLIATITMIFAQTSSPGVVRTVSVADPTPFLVGETGQDLDRAERGLHRDPRPSSIRSYLPNAWH
jgi:hypothetical protein